MLYNGSGRRQAGITLTGLAQANYMARSGLLNSLCILTRLDWHSTCFQETQVKHDSWLFDFDDQWADDPHYVKYDYNHPHQIPAHLHHKFSLVVIDPPFITSNVWQQYAAAADMLLTCNGKCSPKAHF